VSTSFYIPLNRWSPRFDKYPAVFFIQRIAVVSGFRNRATINEHVAAGITAYCVTVGSRGVFYRAAVYFLSAFVFAEVTFAVPDTVILPELLYTALSDVDETVPPEMLTVPS